MLTESQQFANDVIKGKIIAPEFIILSCKKFLKLIKRKDIDYRIDKADKWVRFFETKLIQWEGEWEGEPFILEGWQKFAIHNIYGLYKDGRRLITRAYIQIPRKNGKTVLAAGTAVGHLFMDDVNTPQVLIGANNEDQAKICATSAGELIKASPALNAYYEAKQVAIFNYKDSTSKITHRGRKGSILPMSRDVKTKDGFNPSLGIIDEYHEADNSKLLDVIRSGQGSRLSPLLLVITTAGFKKQGPCYSILRKVSIEILQGKKEDDKVFSMIYEPDKGDDWESVETWKKVNPNYGVSVFPHYLEERHKEAVNEGATKEVDFKTKNLNVWTDSKDVWLSDKLWMLCDGQQQIAQKRWYAGLDMAYKRDYTALVLISEADEKGMHDVMSWFWIPESTIQQKQDKENSNLVEWISQKYVFTTPGNVTDHREVANFILKLREDYEIIQLTADPAYAISTMNQLNDHGLVTMALPQTPTRLTSPTTMLYELVMKQKIRHGGNPVMRWMMGNCVLNVFTNDLIKISKESDINRIDGIDALIDALAPFDVPQDNTTHVAEIW